MEIKKINLKNNHKSSSVIKVTLVSQFFSPDYAATGQLLNQLTILLAKKNIFFRILTGVPSYAFNPKKSKENKQNLFNRKIVRFSNPFKNRKGLRWRIITSLLYSIKVFFALLNKKNREGLIIFTSEPPLLSFFIFLIHFFFRVPYIYLIYDLYPDTIINLKILDEKNPITKAWFILNKYCLYNSKNIILLSELIKEKCILNYGDNLKNKIKIIPSWANINKIKPLIKDKNKFIKKYNLGGKFIILYSGNQGRMHDLKTIIYSANNLKKDKDILFLFIGNGPLNKEIREMEKSLGLQNIRFLPYQPFEKLPQSLTSADIALVSTSKKATYLVAPSKLYGHLAAGTPIALISSENSHIKEIIEENNCGKWFNNGDFISLSEWIVNLKNDSNLRKKISNSARKLSEKISNPNDIANKYYKVIKDSIDND